jgi:hypothetical protein
LAKLRKKLVKAGIERRKRYPLSLRLVSKIACISENDEIEHNGEPFNEE